jgi:hypothetical protein
MGAEEERAMATNNCVGESNGHGKNGRDEERVRAMSKRNGTLKTSRRHMRWRL